MIMTHNNHTKFALFDRRTFLTRAVYVSVEGPLLEFINSNYEIGRATATGRKLN